MCKYILKNKNKQCSRKTEPYCKIHEKIIEKYKECCICLDEKEFYSIKCGHIVCKKCIDKLCKPECPLCRSNLENLPDIIYAKIIDRQFRLEEENLLNESNALIEELNRRRLYTIILALNSVRRF